ncbi:MAG: hypothetical protein ACD_19C00429G0090 [uncultured bacterium]|nr:MAG: hypothetical protein ACD_19C00429G0090 [uncultured bacterium]
MRSGKYQIQLQGELAYKAFIPSLLPRKIKNDEELELLLSEANLALGRLDGISEIVPDIDFLTLMFGRKEATYSSQVEGTQATFADVLKAEAKIEDKKIPYDVQEILNYISAMNYGISRLKTLPLSLRLIKEIHKVLLSNVRGEERQPGEFRKSQNWIGGPTINTASYVPPPQNSLLDLLNNLETFLHSTETLPLLIKTGIIHTQFENIHPFLDGNGRTGRLLVIFYLCYKKILQKPLLYLSVFFKKNQKEYYYRLNRVHENDEIEEWLKFFLRGIIETSKQGFTTAQKILKLRNIDYHKATLLGRTTENGIKVVDSLFKNPFITIGGAVEATKLSKKNAYLLLKRLQKIGILYPIKNPKGLTSGYIYKEYLSLFD